MHLIFLIYIKISLFNTGEYYNEISVDLADYSVIFKNLPLEVHNKRNAFDGIIRDMRRRNGGRFGYFDILVVPRKEGLERMFKRKEALAAKYLKLKD